MKHNLKVQIWNLLDKYLPDEALKENNSTLKQLRNSLEYFTVNELHRDDLIEYGMSNLDDEDMERLADKIGEYTPYWDVINDAYNRVIKTE